MVLPTDADRSRVEFITELKIIEILEGRVCILFNLRSPVLVQSLACKWELD